MFLRDKSRAPFFAEYVMDDKPMTQPDDQRQARVEALLRASETRQHWLREARRFHTKNLFGLWLLLVLGVSVSIFVMLAREQVSLLFPISFLLVLLIVFTGAYVFQEVSTVHRRIDALLKLLEEAERK